MRYYSDVKPNDMKNRIFFLLLFFVCLEWNAYAVIDIQSIHITSSDGLANNTIRDIFQDKKGFIWISTTNGLSRYDGHSFITLLPEKDSPISLADYHVKKIDEDKNGFLWVLSTSNVFSCYDLRHGEFYQFNLSSCIRQQNSLTAQFVSFSLANLANIFYPPPPIFTIINLCLL